MVDYKIIKHGDEVYLEEINDNTKETEQKEPETKELTLIKAKKGEETQDAEVYITYIQIDGKKKEPHTLDIKEFRKDGLIVYQTIQTILTISKNVNNRLSVILSHLGIDKNCEYYYESYRVIRSIIYGNYIIMELYKNGFIVYSDPESLGNFYYALYKELIGGKLPKDEYLEITHINIIDPYAEKDFSLFSNIIDRLRQKIEIKAIKR